MNRWLGAIFILLFLGAVSCKIVEKGNQPDGQPSTKPTFQQATTATQTGAKNPTILPTNTSTAFPILTTTLTPTKTVAQSSTLTASVTPTFGVRPTLVPQDVHFITHGDRTQPYVALTFDLCQDPAIPAGFDEEIYQALVTADAPATFFVGGDWARTHRAEVLRLAENLLFELGNHSWSHPDLIDLAEWEIHAEIRKTQEILYQLTRQQPILFRLPAGLYNDIVLSVIAYQGLYTIQWDVVTADPVLDNSAENINKIVREQVQNGSIIVMHANQRGWNTAEALPEMIDYLRSQGYILVTVSQLIGLEPLPQLP